MKVAIFFQINEFFLHVLLFPIKNNHVGSEGVSPGGDGPQGGRGEAEREPEGVRLSHQGVRH